MLEVVTRDRIATRLVDSEADLPVGDRLPPAELTRWLQRNKYPLLAVAARAPSWLATDPTFQSVLAVERAAYEEQHREYERVRSAWLDAGIGCVMIKSAGSFPSFPHTSDNFDLLVRPEHGRRARDVLRDLGYVEVRNAEEPRKFLFRLFRGGHPVLAVHVHEHVGWMVGFLDDDAVWARQRPAPDDPTVSVPSPEDAFMINLAHAFYENKLLRLNDVARARHALRCAGAAFDWSYARGVAAARGWPDGLAYIVLLFAEVERALFGTTSIPPTQLARFEGDLQPVGFAWRRLERMRRGPAVELPLDLSFPFCKLMYYRKILADTRRTMPQRWLDVGTTLLDGIKERSGVRPQPGMVVALCGPDGSGKTSHARALVRALRTCEIKTDYLWSRGGSTGLARVAGALRARRSSGRGAADGADPSGDHLIRRRDRLRSPILRLGWAWLVALDQISTYLLRARLPAALGRVVVCDRFVYDTAVEMAQSLPPDDEWGRRAIRAMLALTPPPDLGYVLDVPPGVARERRPEEGLPGDLDDTRGRYLRVADESGLPLVPNVGSFADVNDALVRDVITRYMAGYETWLNGLFIANPSQRNEPDPIWMGGGAA